MSIESIIIEDAQAEIIEDLVYGQNDFIQLFIDPPEELSEFLPEDLLTGEEIDPVAVVMSQ